jgi:pimeloyl-ACP methyl ester carboxylesterase
MLDTVGLVKVVRTATGDDERPLLLFLPGLSGNNRQWDLVVAGLGALHCDIAYGAPLLPNPAFGGNRPNVTELAAAITEGIYKLEYRNVIVASHSVGAFVALGIGRRLNGVVSKLLLVNGGLAGVARFIDHPLHEILARPATCLTYLRFFAAVSIPVPGVIKKAIASRPWSVRLAVGGLVSESALKTPESRTSLLEEAGHSQIPLALWQNRHHWSEFQGYADEITVPTVLLTGDCDPITTEKDTRDMVSLLPNLTVRVMGGVGHAAPLEVPMVIIDEISRAVKLHP